MEAYTRLAAEKDKARPQEEAERREGLLNETSFDRRRQLAVYRKDGKRGHHMQVGSRGPHTSMITPSSLLSACGQCAGLPTHSCAKSLAKPKGKPIQQAQVKGCAGCCAA